MALPWLDNGSAVYCRVWGVGPSARPLKYCLVSRWPWCGWAWGTGAGGRNAQFQGPDRRPPLSPPWLPQPLFMLLADITHQSRHGPAHPRQPRSLDSEPQASIRRGREPGGGVSAQNPHEAAAELASPALPDSSHIPQPHGTLGRTQTVLPLAVPSGFGFNPKHEGGWARKGFGFIPLDAQDLARAPGRRSEGAWPPASTNKGFLY